MNRKTRWAVVLWVFAAWCSTGPYAGTTLLTPEQTANIKALVAAGKQPWKQGYDEFIAKADAHLGITPLSVTYQGDTGHILISQSPYDWSNNMANSPCGASYCDGQKNPLADNADATAIATLCKAVRDLGIAYAFTNDSKYADKAVSLIYTWFLAPATYMEPWVPDSPSWAQEINVCNISLHNAYCGASLIWDYAGWPAQQRSAFIDWVNEFAGIMKILGPYGGNWESWRLLTLSSGAACVGNATDLAYAFDTWKSGLPTRMNTSGAWVSDLSRTNSLFYSMYNLTPMTMVAVIAENNGTDLFGYSVDGRNLELSWDYHAPYVVDPATWPYQQITAYNEFGMDVYEIAYSKKQKPAYKTVLDAINRPFYDQHVGGPMTLIHAYRRDSTSVPTVPKVAPGTTLAVTPDIPLTFIVTDPGTYMLTGFVKAPAPGANSFFIEMDQTPGTRAGTADEMKIWDLALTDTLQLQNVSWRGANWSSCFEPGCAESNPKTWNLTAGTHTLYIVTREPGTVIESVRFTKDTPVALNHRYQHPSVMRGGHYRFGPEYLYDLNGRYLNGRTVRRGVYFRYHSEGGGPDKVLLMD